MMNMREAVLFLALLKRQFTQSGAVCVIRLRYEWISPSLSLLRIFMPRFSSFILSPSE